MESDQPIPPTARIRRYVDDLVARWPDITTEAGDDSPWADGPLIGNASGPMIYFAMITSSGPEVVDEVAHYAAAVGGLVCFDPQTGTLRQAEPRGRDGQRTSHTAPLTPAMNTTTAATPPVLDRLKSPVCVASPTPASSPSKWAAPAWPPNPADPQRDHCRIHRLTYRGFRFPVRPNGACWPS
jgi:hypothetical protein